MTGGGGGQRGFTIVEVVVAIVILTMGVLGLVSTAATVTRMVGQGQRYNKASSLAAQQFEILRATGCGSMSSGSSAAGGYTVAWTVSSVTNGKQVSMTVTSPTTRGIRTDAFTSIVSCVGP